MSELPERVCITGAGGFVAGRLVPRLTEAGVHIVGVIRPGRAADTLTAQGVEIRHGDLSEPERSAGLFAGVDAIVHLAGLAHAPAMVDQLASVGLDRGVFVSSTGVYTKLPSAGAESKRVGERALRTAELGHHILRPSMIYGTMADRNMSRLLRLLTRTPVVPVPGDGGTLQQPVHVDDLVDVILTLLADPNRRGCTYDVGGPEPLTLRSLIAQSAVALARRAVVVPVPLKPTHRAIGFAARLGLPTPVRAEQVLRLTESKAVDITRTQTDLGFSPRSFEDGIGAQAEELLSMQRPGRRRVRRSGQTLAVSDHADTAEPRSVRIRNS